MNSNKLYLVFDIESVGLHGEGFAVGWVVIDNYAVLHEASYFACLPEHAYGTDTNRKWVKENIPYLEPTHSTPMEVRDAFWAVWLKRKALGAVLVTDCGWPVESRFLADCVDSDRTGREWEGPYPLYDLASILLARGKDPLAITARLEDELPQHNPLADARQSARILIENLYDN